VRWRPYGLNGASLSERGATWLSPNAGDSMVDVNAMPLIRSAGPASHQLVEVPVEVRPLNRFRRLIGEARYGELRTAANRARRELTGVTVWNVSSTATGGGVAELLRCLIGYTLDAGMHTRWMVLQGGGSFFALTKRLHNRLHGFPGDDGELGAAERSVYEQVSEVYGQHLTERIHPGDVVLLHDPQTAGLTPFVRRAGGVPVWRCHIGADAPNPLSGEAWSFLRPYVERSTVMVFSRTAFVPDWVPASKVVVIPPSIDPFSPKNEELSATEVVTTLRSSHIAQPSPRQAPAGGPAVTPMSTGRAALLTGRSLLSLSRPLVLQVSRWDRLKDMIGVMRGFGSRAMERSDAQLALVGSEVTGVADDPEGASVLAECLEAWHHLPVGLRRRVRLMSLPMNDVVQNATMVNALQRHATVVVQKSLAEGFGLTVAEAMWKGKPIVASAVGGIVDQLDHDCGVLLEDPTDLDRFGEALSSLLARPELMATLGGRARQKVLSGFVGDRHLMAYAMLMERILP
jgi:trehalose synthase